MFDHALHAYLRALVGSRAVRVGPFLVSLDDHDAGLFRNYAIPDDGAEPTLDQVADLVAVFTARGRTPRLEYLPGLCPKVEPRLGAAGFVPERRLPVLTCVPATVLAPPVPDGIGLDLVSSNVQLRQVAEAQNEAYGQPKTTDHDVARLRSTLDAGGLVAVALDSVLAAPWPVGSARHRTGGSANSPPWVCELPTGTAASRQA